ncbi:hypothetical protein D0Z07_6230 [Hyphodiscus hymeniophilus]|uniref:Sec39 domain-containing protein n=1 Tax=Hyphodiscus hymeniophilus TaxID=353542 RepID=A0A9P7AUX4_9HELO|nr:hypothetical protein D0Z07_6230 [Hyphodiscus hymeniophilus]
MAGSELSPAKALLLAVQLATNANLSALRTLVSQHPKTLRTEIILRILLTHLPESLESSEYVPFIQDLIARNVVEDSASPIDASALEDLSESAASKRARKLHLLPLLWRSAPADAPADPLTQFLIHRSLRIDEITGLVTQIPDLVVPFIHHSAYLRTWMISTVLPLLRFNYEYHPQDSANMTLSAFGKLDNQAGIAMLLSRTEGLEENEKNVGRDLRGLVGPWMYGDTRLKRRRLEENSSSLIARNVEPLDAPDPDTNEKCASWEVVFTWTTEKATDSWKTVVSAVEQWDGPGDVDLGGYEDGTGWLEEEDQQHLERRYARAALACAYLISDDSMDALLGIRRILGRIHTLLDLDPLPTLEVAGALLSPVSGIESLLSPTNSGFLRGGLLEEGNVLTTPNESSIKLLHALLVSAFLIRRCELRTSIRLVGQLVLLEDERDQKYEFEKLVQAIISKGPQSDDRYWVRVRNELLWLRSWGAEELTEGASVGKGVFGKVPKELIEVALLRGLLSNNRISLARRIYQIAPERPIPHETLQETVLSEAMNAYDNATNANKTRGGLKKCDDMYLRCIYQTEFIASVHRRLMHKADKALVCMPSPRHWNTLGVTHTLGKYSLYFKHGEPFKPVSLRVHGDPISIIARVLELNNKSYTRINDFINISKGMVLAGLTFRTTIGLSTIFKKTVEQVKEQLVIAEKRVVSMCVDQALSEDDFETAYSYIMTRLVKIAGPAQERKPHHDSINGLFAELPPKELDEWSWRAALQAGSYHRTEQTIAPTHLGNSSGNPMIRHLEQRMECLSLALRLAPKAALQSILNTFRRCEEELESLAKQEAEQEAAWDAQGDEQAMPGGFGSALKTTVTKSSRAEEGPMSLFDLSRGAISRAQSGLGSLSRAPATDSSIPRERKRDQLRNAAVGTVAAGVGWLIGAPAPATHE